MDYNHKSIDIKWQSIWDNSNIDKVTIDESKPKYYVLDMFPYPSGNRLHVGHTLGYIASDIYARYKKLQGFNVLHPMGFDAFGLPAEQHAINTGQSPVVTTEKNIATYKEQLKKVGLSYDWDREIRTCDPDYYKWTQNIFLSLFKSWYNKGRNQAESIDNLIYLFSRWGNTVVHAHTTYDKVFTGKQWNSYSAKEKEDILQHYRLAYLGYADVNWCPYLGTVLANDEIQDGKSIRGGHPVEKKPMRQWFLRITAYAERLFEDLKDLDWPNSIKEIQKNWIYNEDGSLRMRDAIFSRQRYWGEPIPIFYKDGIPCAMSTEDLPLRLPKIKEYLPSGTGQSPLVNVKEWIYRGYPLETNTMPGWAGSSWYYLRYLDPKFNLGLATGPAVSYWDNIDLYMGGAEHATGHLLYIRFWTKFLFDIMYLPFNEPAKKLINQGMILGENGEKMSKSRGNVINPDDIIDKYGADTFRIYEMFLGPIEQHKPWQTTSIEGSYRFMKRFWSLYESVKNESFFSWLPSANENKALHKCIKNVNEDIEKLSFNTCVSHFMVCVNELTSLKCTNKYILEKLAILIAPFAPHTAEEVWSVMEHRTSIFTEKYPVFNPSFIKETVVTYPIQINGKKKDEIEVPIGTSNIDVKTLVINSKKIQSLIGDNIIKNVIVVQNKIVNIVI